MAEQQTTDQSDTADAASVVHKDLDGYLKDIEALETVFETWDETQAGVVQTYRDAIEALHKEAIKRFINTLKTEPAAMAAMKGAVSDEVVYAVLRHLQLVKPSLHERVEEALESVRPMLDSHGGGVELISVQAPDTVEVRFLGSCDGCPASMLTFVAGVKKAIEDHCPEITNIKQVKGLVNGSGEAGGSGVQFISPFALNQKGDWLKTVDFKAVPEGGILTMDVDGQDVILSRNGAVISCFQNACAHLGMPLDMGDIKDGIITCPHHGFQYDLRSGECLTAPEVQLQPHAVRITRNQVEVRLAR